MTHYPRFIDPPSPQHIRQDGSFPVTFFHEDLDLSKQLSTEFKLSLYFFLTTLSFSIGARTISNWTSISSPVHSKVRCGIFFLLHCLKENRNKILRSQSNYPMMNRSMTPFSSVSSHSIYTNSRLIEMSPLSSKSDNRYNEYGQFGSPKPYNTPPPPPVTHIVPSVRQSQSSSALLESAKESSSKTSIRSAPSAHSVENPSSPPPPQELLSKEGVEDSSVYIVL